MCNLVWHPTPTTVSSGEFLNHRERTSLYCLPLNCPLYTSTAAAVLQTTFFQLYTRTADGGAAARARSRRVVPLPPGSCLPPFHGTASLPCI